MLIVVQNIISFILLVLVQVLALNNIQFLGYINPYIYILFINVIKFIFTSEFQSVDSLLKWLLLGDFFKVLTLAFGYQIVVKTMMKLYFFGEIFYNLLYYFLTLYLIKEFGVEGAMQAYFYTNVIHFIFILFMFRKLFFK